MVFGPPPRSSLSRWRPPCGTCRGWLLGVRCQGFPRGPAGALSPWPSFHTCPVVTVSTGPSPGSWFEGVGMGAIACLLLSQGGQAGFPWDLGVLCACLHELRHTFPYLGIGNTEPHSQPRPPFPWVASQGSPCSPVHMRDLETSSLMSSFHSSERTHRGNSRQLSPHH